jgi:hypothetical protein
MRKVFVFAAAVLVTMPLLSLAHASARAQEHLLADLNNDDRVTLEEFQKHRRNAIMEADHDKDGKVSPAEWSKGQERLRNYMQREDIDGWKAIGTGNLFTTLDADKDGFVEPGEVDAFTAPRFAAVDLDHNGYVTEPEAEKFEKLHGY